MVDDQSFFAPRRCMRAPIDEIFEASQMLNRATDAHLAGDRSGAERLIGTANSPTVRAWSESLWGRKAANPDQWQYHRFRAVAGAPPYLPRAQRIAQRMPSSAEKSSIVERYGRN